MANNYMASTSQASDAMLAELSGGISDLQLSDKRVILSNPGTMFNDIYYSRVNTVQSLSEVTYNMGRYNQSLSSLQFGGTSTIIVPNGSLLSTFYLHLEIIPSVTNANITLPRGWALAALRQVSYLMGSSNVPNISLDKHSIFQVLMGQCENAEKRTEMLHLAGEETFGFVANVPIVADLIIPLPWSSAVGRDQKLPLPTDLLSNPITVQISFDTGSAFIGGTGTRPNAFSVGTALMRQGDMLNRDAGLRPVMYRNPSLIYGYPFIHFQSNQFPLQITNTAQNTITLTGFINADLLGISFGVEKDTDAITTGLQSVRPFNYQELSNVEVLFNGLVMHTSPGRAYKLTNMNSMNGASYVENSNINAAVVAPFLSAPVNTYIMWIDFSRLKCEQFTGHYDNVWRVPNNTITLRFACPAGAAVDRATVQTTFFYSGIANIRQGETTIFFD